MLREEDDERAAMQRVDDLISTRGCRSEASATSADESLRRMQSIRAEGEWQRTWRGSGAHGSERKLRVAAVHCAGAWAAHPLDWRWAAYLPDASAARQPGGSSMAAAESGCGRVEAASLSTTISLSNNYRCCCLLLLIRGVKAT